MRLQGFTYTEPLRSTTVGKAIMDSWGRHVVFIMDFRMAPPHTLFQVSCTKRQGGVAYLLSSCKTYLRCPAPLWGTL